MFMKMWVCSVCCFFGCNTLRRCTVHDTENLTFSADYRTGNLHIAVQPSAYVCTDNRAEQLADSVWNSADIINSRTDLLCLFIFTEIVRIIPSRISP